MKLKVSLIAHKGLMSKIFAHQSSLGGRPFMMRMSQEICLLNKASKQVCGSQWEWCVKRWTKGNTYHPSLPHHACITWPTSSSKMLALQGSLINRPFNGCEPKMACSPRHSNSPNNRPLCEPRMACSPSFLLTSPCLCHLACITLAYITKAKLVHQGLLSTFHRPF